MLKRRVIACLVVKNGIVVQSIGFNKYLPVGKPKIAVEFLNHWGIDEIILVDIEAGRNGFDPNYAMIKDLSTKCHVPLTVGGGITSIEQIKKLMDCGVDKIAINHSAIQNNDLITSAANVFGNQCVVVSVDAIKSGKGYKVFDSHAYKATDVDVLKWCKKAEDLGAGEIFLTSVDRDGTYTGFEIELMKSVAAQMKIPVIASGGAGNAKHFVELFGQTTVSAASAANFFHFSEHAVVTTKSGIEKEMEIRLETSATYKENVINEQNRLLKKDDKTLEDLLYIRIEKEII